MNTELRSLSKEDLQRDGYNSFEVESDYGLARVIVSDRRRGRKSHGIPNEEAYEYVTEVDGHRGFGIAESEEACLAEAVVFFRQVPSKKACAALCAFFGSEEFVVGCAQQMAREADARARLEERTRWADAAERLAQYEYISEDDLEPEPSAREKELQERDSRAFMVFAAAIRSARVDDEGQFESLYLHDQRLLELGAKNDRVVAKKVVEGLMRGWARASMEVCQRYDEDEDADEVVQPTHSDVPASDIIDWMIQVMEGGVSTVTASTVLGLSLEETARELIAGAKRYELETQRMIADRLRARRGDETIDSIMPTK